MPLLYSAPKSVPLNIKEGYILNQLNGDSIRPLINSSGDTLRTGVAIQVTAKVIPAGKASQSHTFKTDDSKVVPAQLKVHPIPKDPWIVQANIDSLKAVAPYMDNSSFVLLNSTGDTIPTGIPVPVRGKVVPCTQPQPVKALPFRMKDNASLNLRYLDVDQGMKSSWVKSILEDSRGNLWFGTGEDGVIRFDGETFTHYSEKEGYSGKAVYCMLEDRHGNLWFGNEGGGVCMFDGLSFTQFTEKEDLTNSTVYSIIEDTQGHLWFGTSSGAYRYNGETLTLYSEKEGLSNNTILSILEDSRGYIWFGTGYGGACVYQNESFTYITEKESLSNNTVYSIIEDLDHNIWLGTEQGLNLLVFDKKDTTTDTFNNPIIHTYGIQDGLQSKDFYSNSAFLDSNNRMWWGTDKGLIMLDMNKFNIPHVPPVVQLNHIEINDQFFDFRDLGEKDRKNLKFSGVADFYNYPLSLKLAYHKNHLAFHFSAIDWSAQQKIRYSFKLEGLNNSWSLPSESAVAEYRQLPFGT